ncbi:MAG: hypothetical protein ABIU63_09115 [Chitinophagaceae bacterium]
MQHCPIDIKIYTLIVLMLLCYACHRAARPPTDQTASGTGLILWKTMHNQAIGIRVLPLASGEKRVAGQADAITIRLTLTSKQKMSNQTMVQYMNFGITKNVLAIMGNDTLPCRYIERIPGIAAQEFIYLGVFGRSSPRAGNHEDLRICITDTLAGFGYTAFEISHHVLELPAIKK